MSSVTPTCDRPRPVDQHPSDRCRRHHKMIHNAGWTVIGDANGTIVFTGPEGVQPRTRPPNLHLPLRI